MSQLTFIRTFSYFIMQIQLDLNTSILPSASVRVDTFLFFIFWGTVFR